MITEEQRAETIATRELSWQQLLTELPSINLLPEIDRRLLRTVFDYAWADGGKFGLRTAQEIMQRLDKS
jgi:hypothetical protein